MFTYRAVRRGRKRCFTEFYWQWAGWISGLSLLSLDRRQRRQEFLNWRSILNLRTCVLFNLGQLRIAAAVLRDPTDAVNPLFEFRADERRGNIVRPLRALANRPAQVATRRRA